ncbi:MAG: hypothetical protein WBQ48_02550, partial [Aeromicrobium sp.]
MRHVRSRASLLGLVGGGAIVAALLSPLTASAEESVKKPKPDKCAGAQMFSEADRLAGNCLPGNDIAKLRGAPTGLAAGETASSPNTELLANLPKVGAFDSPGAYNSDLAFQGEYAYAGNYNGFMVYDISTPSAPTVVSQVVCPGAQNDVSVYGDLLVLSTDSSRNDESCQSTSQSATVKESWEGIKLFDISDPAQPRYVSAIETPCGSHTHTLAPDKGNKNGKGEAKGLVEDLYVYVSSYSPNAAFPDCQPPLDTVSVVKVPLESPESAAMVGQPVLFPDGGNPGGNGSATTSGCHDLTAYPSKDVMAGACMGDGILLDISDRANPQVTERVRD